MKTKSNNYEHNKNIQIGTHQSVNTKSWMHRLVPYNLCIQSRESQKQMKYKLESEQIASPEQLAVHH